MEKMRIAVMVSGGGSNLQSILDASRTGNLKDLAEVVLVASNKRDAFALERAKKAGVDALTLEPKSFTSRAGFYAALIEEFEKRNVGLVCLAGFLLKVEPNLVQRYRGRILNIHPALLPKYGGPGMYGHHVHEAVLRAGETESGCTVHVVDEEFDHGPVLLQRKAPVLPGDDAQTLAARVLKEEHRLYPEAIEIFIRKQLPPETRS